MKLSKVTLTRADSCLSYALKRIGWIYSSEEVVSYDWFKNRCDGGMFVKVSTPITGDLLVKLRIFNEEQEHHAHAYEPVTILEDGRIISNRILINGFHVGVMERKDMVSEMTMSGNDYPTIRVRSLDDYRADKKSNIEIWRWNR